MDENEQHNGTQGIGMAGLGAEVAGLRLLAVLGMLGKRPNPSDILDGTPHDTPVTDDIIGMAFKALKDVEWQPTHNDNLCCYHAGNGLYVVRHISFQGLESYYFIQANSSQDAVNKVLRYM